MDPAGLSDRRRFFLAAGSVLAVAGCRNSVRHDETAGSAGPTLEYSGAKWFDGEAFIAKTGWSRAGRLTFQRPSRVDAVIDLADCYLVPPFADAHSHSIGVGRADWDLANVRRYLSDGVFYVQSQGNLPLTGDEKLALGLNVPDGLQATLSNATLTGPDDPLVAVVLPPQFAAGYFGGHTIETLENVRYFKIGSVQELDAKWPLIRAQHDDFIKVYLWNTEGRELPAGLPPPMRSKTALSPQVFEAIVARAHAEGLHVSAHVTTIGDFRLSVRAGVDQLAHIPAFGEVTAEDARACAEAGTAVSTTLGNAARQLPNLPPPLRPVVEAMQAAGVANLRALHAAGVDILVGADTPEDTTTLEAEFLLSLGVWDNAAMLRAWGTTTPRAIFPGLKIGELSEGFEASFLALAGDPLLDWSMTRAIRERRKQGRRLRV